MSYSLTIKGLKKNRENADILLTQYIFHYLRSDEKGLLGEFKVFANILAYMRLCHF